MENLKKFKKSLKKLGFEYNDELDEYNLNISDCAQGNYTKDEVMMTVCLDTMTVSIDTISENDVQSIFLTKIYTPKQLKNFINALNGY